MLHGDVESSETHLFMNYMAMWRHTCIWLVYCEWFGKLAPNFSLNFIHFFNTFFEYIVVLLVKFVILDLKKRVLSAERSIF